MRITVDDCLKLDAFEGSSVLSCMRKSDRRVRSVSVFDEDNIENGVERNGIKEQMVLTHFWNFKDNIDAQCRIVSGLGRKSVAALVIFLNKDGVRTVDMRVIKAAEENGLLIISIPDDVRVTYSVLTEQVLDKILYGSNYSDNVLNNTIYHLLNFEKHRNFESALSEAAINNDYQVVLLTTEFNPILTIETRHLVTVDAAIQIAKRNDIAHATVFKKIVVEDMVTYWGNININGEVHILMLVDNEDNYSATEMTKLAEVIELAMGMWKYTPERDARAEFIKSAIRGDLLFCNTLVEEAGLKGKKFISVFYATGINNIESQDIIDTFKIQNHFGILSYFEGNNFYGLIYADEKRDLQALKLACLDMFEELKNGRKDVRIFHSTGIDTLELAIDSFGIINDTWNYVEKVFPYKRVFTKYDMILVLNCISIQRQGTQLKKMYLDLLTPFVTEVSQNKGKALLDTLETFILDAGTNSSKTAEFMGIHNNTVQYRLKRINEILGADMMANRVIPGLTIALALRRLEDN